MRRREQLRRVRVREITLRKLLRPHPRHRRREWVDVNLLRQMGRNGNGRSTFIIIIVITIVLEMLAEACIGSLGLIL